MAEFGEAFEGFDGTLKPGAANGIGLMLDCDGVLLDSMGAWKAAEAAVCALVGVVPTKEDTDTVNTMTIDEAGGYFHDKYGLGKDARDVARMIDDNMIGFYEHEAVACKGALEFVAALRAAGARAVVVSSSPMRYLNAGLGNAQLAPCLDGIFSAGDLGLTKRERPIFDKAHDLLGTEASLTWGFDDTAYALNTMRGVGFLTVGIYSGDENSTVPELRKAAEHVYAGGLAELGASQFLAFAR